MKRRFLLPAAAIALCLGLLVTGVLPAQGQAEKIKQKAKDLKKNVENGQSPTNKPPAKTPPAPPAPPQKPAR